MLAKSCMVEQLHHWNVKHRLNKAGYIWLQSCPKYLTVCTTNSKINGLLSTTT